MWYNAVQVDDATEMDVQGGQAQCFLGTPAHPAAEKPSCLQTQCRGGLPSCLVAIGATEYQPGKIHSRGWGSGCRRKELNANVLPSTKVLYFHPAVEASVPSYHSPVPVCDSGTGSPESVPAHFVSPMLAVSCG